MHPDNPALTRLPAMQPNNAAADLKPQGEAATKVKVRPKTCAFPLIESFKY